MICKEILTCSFICFVFGSGWCLLYRLALFPLNIFGDMMVDMRMPKVMEYLDVFYLYYLLFEKVL